MGYLGELRRMPLPRTWVNKGMEKGRSFLRSGPFAASCYYLLTTACIPYYRDQDPPRPEGFGGPYLGMFGRQAESYVD